MLRWQWSTFSELTVLDLYELLRLRQEVFIIEQNCPYPDADGKDVYAHHLLGWNASPPGHPELLAYLRVLPPGVSYPELSMGRIVTAPAVRGSGMGKMLMEEGFRRIESAYGKQPIRISAQAHLKRFYELFGFYQVSEPYDEDGILHIEMLRNAGV